MSPARIPSFARSTAARNFSFGTRGAKVSPASFPGREWAARPLAGSCFAARPRPFTTPAPARPSPAPRAAASLRGLPPPRDRRIVPKKFLQPIESRDRGIHLLVFVAFAGDADVGQEEEALPRVIERDDRGKKEKEAVGNLALAGMTVRNVLEEPDRVVGEKADSARAERRQVGIFPEPRADHQALQRLEGRALDRAALPPPLLLDGLAADRQARDRPATEKCVAGDGLASFHALEQEALRARPPHAPEERDGRQRVGRADAGHGHDARDRGASQEIVLLRLAPAHGFRLFASAAFTAPGGRPLAVIAAAR